MQRHDDGCPDCPGSIELVPLGGRPQESIATLERVGTPFDMCESSDLDGALRLKLRGGLDIVVADRLTARLRVLRSFGRPVRIDLSELEFIDCTGLEALIGEVTSARRARQPIEVDRPVSAPVKRVITFMNVASELWPAVETDARPALRVIDGDASTSDKRVDAVRPPRTRLHSLGPPEDPSAAHPGTPGASAS